LTSYYSVKISASLDSRSPLIVVRRLRASEIYS